MKLAMLSFRLPQPRTKRGGTERIAHELANGLSRRGHEVTVWSGDPAPFDAVYTVRRIPFDWLLHSWLGFRLVSGYLGNLLALLPNYEGAQGIIAHGDSLLLPLRRLPLLRIMHGSALDEARTARSVFRKILQFGVYLQERLTVRTQTTVAVSENTRWRYPAVAGVIPNGTDTGRFHVGLAEKSTDPSILFVGTLGGRKRGKLMLDWFVHVIRPAMPNAALWMVTEEGPMIEGVRYYTGASDDLLAKLYRRAWVVASPSVYEGFGLPLVEAMASGTPVVATANPGSREVLEDGRYGCLIENDEDFAPVILDLLRDHVERAHCAERGLRRAKELSLEKMIDGYEAVLHDLVPLAAPVEAGVAHAEYRRARSFSA